MEVVLGYHSVGCAGMVHFLLYTVQVFCWDFLVVDLAVCLSDWIGLRLLKQFHGRAQ